MRLREEKLPVAALSLESLMAESDGFPGPNEAMAVCRSVEDELGKLGWPMPELVLTHPGVAVATPPYYGRRPVFVCVRRAGTAGIERTAALIDGLSKGEEHWIS